MLNDLRAAFQFVLRRRGFSLIAALTLAMGIAANVTVFALVRAVILTPKPYRAARELFQLLPADHMSRSPFNLEDVSELKKISDIVQVGACKPPSIPTGRTRPTLLASVTEVSRDFFATLDAPPKLGRVLQPSDFETGARSAVISYDLWNVLRGKSSDIVGSRLRLNWETYTVVGVMPPSFAPSCSDEDVRRQAWVPIEATAGSRDSRASLQVVVRVSPAQAVPRVQEQLDAYGMHRSEQTGLAAYAGMYLQPNGLAREKNALPGLLLLQSLAACLLLVACANLGSLFLLDASRRDTEFLTRAFLGASAGRIIRHLFLESLVISVSGSAAGVGLAFVLGSAVRSVVTPVVPRGVTYHVGIGDAIVGVATGIATSLLFAVLAAVIATRRARQTAGRTEVNATAGRSVRRLQDVLVAVQVGLSVVLAVSMVVVGLSYVSVARTNTGLDANGVVTSEIYLTSDVSPDRIRSIEQSVTNELNQIGGSQRITFSSTPPFAGGSHVRVLLDDPNSTGPRSLSTEIRSVTSNYFDVLRVHIRAGRSLDAAAELHGDVGEAVASARLAKEFGGDSLIGRVIKRADSGAQYRIVGVADDVRTIWIWQPPGPTLYVGLEAATTTKVSVLVRTPDTNATSQALRSVIARVVPDAPEVAVEPLAAIVWNSEKERTFYVAIVSAFSIIAVTIAAMGTYIAVRRMVALRTKEFAIRMSLGAGPRSLQVGVLGNALSPVLVGIGAGLLSVWWLTSACRALQHSSILIDVVMRTAPRVVPTAASVAVAAFLLAGIACWLPARRAASVNPAVLLKSN